MTADQIRIQKEIDACHQAGGGVVRIEPGEHRSGTLNLKSGVSLHLEAGARLIGVDDLDAYPTLAPTVNESTDIRALIHADKAKDIGITGEGIIDGNADRPLLGKDIAREPTRPELIFLRNCSGVKIKDVSMRNASFWTLHLMRCQDVQIDGISIRNRRDRINTDGIDPDGCRNVRITNCSIETGDDCIVLKSTEGDDCEDIIVSNCQLTTHCAGLKLGTESIGKIRNVIFNGCIIRDSRMALGLFMKDGGEFDTIIATNLIIEDNTEFPIFIDSAPRYHNESANGTIRKVRIQNCFLKSPGRLFVCGNPDQPIQNLEISHLHWTLTGYLELGAAGKPPGSVRLREDPDRIRHEAQQAQLTLAHIRGLSMNHISLTEARRGSSPDRIPLYCHDITHERIENIADTGVEWRAH